MGPSFRWDDTEFGASFGDKFAQGRCTRAANPYSFRQIARNRESALKAWTGMLLS
jgi:hypothetical protein